jgi:hypothetical protein
MLESQFGDLCFVLGCEVGELEAGYMGLAKEWNEIFLNNCGHGQRSTIL